MIGELLGLWLWIGKILAMAVAGALIFAGLSKIECVQRRLGATPEDYLSVAITAVLFWVLPVIVVAMAVAPGRVERFLEKIESVKPAFVS